MVLKYLADCEIAKPFGGPEILETVLLRVQHTAGECREEDSARPIHTTPNMDRICGFVRFVYFLC